jgi:hypothetical protein
MRIGCGSCACLYSCYDFTQKALATTVIKLDEIRRDPEAFQKACIVGRSVIQGINICCQRNYCPQFISVLNFAESFDFYGFFRLPRYFIYPYVPELLDEYAILDQLEVILCDNWNLGVPDEQGRARDNDVHQFAKAQLTAFLDKMVDDDQTFRTEEEVKTVLNHWLKKTLEVYPQAPFDPQVINLHHLSIPLKKRPRLEVLIDATFVGIDIACVPAFLQDWGLIDLARYSNQLGNFPSLKSMHGLSLDTSIWGAMSLGFSLQFIYAGYCLIQGGLTPAESKDAKWLMAASLAEFLYALANHQKKDPRLIIFLALIAKSLGLLGFLCASKPSFFNNDT